MARVQVICLTQDIWPQQVPEKPLLVMPRSWGPICPLHLNPKAPSLREKQHCLGFLVLKLYQFGPFPLLSPGTYQDLENEAVLERNQAEEGPPLSYSTFHGYKYFCKLNEGIVYFIYNDCTTAV